MGALTQKQTDRLNVLDKKEQLTADEKKELNILQKIHAGEDTDADNEGGDNNPVDFEAEETPNEKSLDDKSRQQHENTKNP